MNEVNILDGVEDTLYIPLVGRIYASRRFPTFFYDEKALSLERYIPTDSINKNSSEYFYLASVCRQHTIDAKIRTFLRDHPEGNVVFLGAGLETAYDRIGGNRSKGHFYQVDLPNVIKTRQRVLGQGENERLIGQDMFRLGWIEELDTQLPTLITVSGVYQYFPESQIIDMIRGMKSQISGGELVFDATSSKGLAIANKYVRKTGNINAQMHFSLDHPQEFAQRTDTHLMSVEGFFQRALKACPDLQLKTKIYMYLADRWHRTLVVHLKFN